MPTIRWLLQLSGGQTCRSPGSGRLPWSQAPPGGPSVCRAALQGHSPPWVHMAPPAGAQDRMLALEVEERHSGQELSGCTVSRPGLLAPFPHIAAMVLSVSHTTPGDGAVRSLAQRDACSQVFRCPRQGRQDTEGLENGLSAGKPGTQAQLKRPLLRGRAGASQEEAGYPSPPTVCCQLRTDTFCGVKGSE